MATLENPSVTTAHQIIDMVNTHGYYVVMDEFEDYSAEAHRYLTHKYRGQFDWRECRYAMKQNCLYIWDSPVAVMKKERKINSIPLVKLKKGKKICQIMFTPQLS